MNNFAELAWVSRIYRGAAVYGLLVILPTFFAESRIGVDLPPPITHPEFFYGFLCVATVCQLLFLVIAKDPVRHRGLMPLAILEKIPYGILAIWLYAGGRIPGMSFGFGLVDLLLGTLFLWTYRVTPERAPAATPT